MGPIPPWPGILGKHGYATAGFTANYWYCASSSGLDRGFTVYHDFIFPRLDRAPAGGAGPSSAGWTPVG